MSELQASLEFQVELSKFYNVDLFQRGYYQVRTALKVAPKAPVKTELSLPRNNESSLVFPASVMNGVAVSKTFQILYRNEDVSVDDVILFKVQMLVDAQRIEESIQQAEFQLAMELWFTEEEVGPEYLDKLQCISQRLLKLNIDPAQGLHHHVPVLFDYFHLSVICVSIHASLLALHQPYISIPGRVPKPAWTSKDQSPLENIYFSASSRPNTPGFNNIDIKLREACAVHKVICHLLLSAYESLQHSFQTVVARLPPYCKKIRIEQVDCHKKLDLILEVMQGLDDEEDFLQTAQSDVAQLCAENVILWAQYLELVTLHEKVTHQLAKEHHVHRVKRFAEVFFTCEHPKRDVIACYENTTHSHTDLVTLVRNSRYFQNIPALDVECAEIDGDPNTIPIVFEDIFCEGQPARQFKSDEGVEMRNKHRLSHSSNSSDVSSDSSPKFKHSSKLNFIKNIKPETFKRPSVTGGGQSRNVTTNVAGMAPVKATLVGYKKMNTDNDNAPIVELGTLSPAPNLTSGRLNQIAASMPSLLGQNHAHTMFTGSMPDLNRSLSLKESLLKKAATKKDSIDEDSRVAVRRRLTLPSDTMSPMLSKDIKDGEDKMEQDVGNGKLGEDRLSSSLSDSSTGDIQNGFVPSSNGASDTGDTVCTSCVSSNTDSNAQHSTQHDDKINQTPVSVRKLNEALTQTLEKNSAHPNSDSGGNSSAATSEIPTEASVDSGMASLHDVTISNKIVTDMDSKRESPLNSNTVRNSSDRTLVHTDSKSSIGKASLTKSASSTSANSAMSDSYLTTECTIMELLKEEYKNTQTASDNEGDTPRRRGVGLGLKGSLGVGKAVPVTSSSSSSGATSSNSVVTKPRQLVSPVADKTIDFIAAKESLRKLLRYQGCIYSDFPTQCSSVPYFWPAETHHSHHHHSDTTSSSEPSTSSNDEGLHLIVCVHGLDGNSADLRLVRTYLELALPGARMDFLMSERNQPDTFADFEAMTDKLVDEILYHIDIYGMEPSRISFVGHSLGNLIIRSALSRPKMAPLLNKLHTFLSLSAPHLGMLYNSSGLVNMGMWFMQKWKKSGSLLQLSLKDHSDPRETFLYKLSMKPGMEYFKNILLVSSTQDRYVPFHSSRIELCKSALKDTSGLGGVYAEMVNNILQPLVYKSTVTLVRYDVFHALNNTANSIIGRAAHIAVLDSELFIEKFLTVAALKYFQ